jgi:hypothetical protein
MHGKRTPAIRPRAKKPDLRVCDILSWADAFHNRHGRWPKYNDGQVDGTADQTWAAADQCLRAGHRGLPGGDTLAKLLLRCRGRRHRHLPPDLTIPQILTWADAHFQRTGHWPGGHCTELIPEAPKGLTWVAVELALARGKRGLPGGVTLAQFLEQHRGVRNRLNVPDFTVSQILDWADAHFSRTGKWPRYQDGVIAGTRETWQAVDTALARGHRGLPGGVTLRKFLARHRGVRNKSALPHMTVAKIAAWAKAHKKRTGKWPAVKTGAIPEAPGETWSGVNAALEIGIRGLPGKDSLAKLLSRECGKRNLADVPPLSLEQVRVWILNHHRKTGKWPKYNSGPILDVPGETWSAADNALHRGTRGLPGGSSVAKVVEICLSGHNP